VNRRERNTKEEEEGGTNFLSEDRGNKKGQACLKPVSKAGGEQRI